MRKFTCKACSNLNSDFVFGQSAKEISTFSIEKREREKCLILTFKGKG